MAVYTDDELNRMTDEELEAAFLDVQVDEEGEVEDLEQPVDNEDSEDDTSSDETEDEEFEEDSENEEEDLDGDSDENDEDLSDEDEDSDEDEQPVRKFKYKANGKDYEFSEEEILEKFGQVFAQAQNYTQKMQTIKPWRKTIDAIEQAELSAEDINLAIDVLKGDKDAINELLKRKGIDALELDSENSKYQPKDYGRNETEIAIKEIVDEIKDDAEYATTFNVLEKQWDGRSRQAFVDDPEKIRLLHIDVKSGMYDTIAPIANKIKVFDGGGKSDLEYYQEAARQYFADQERNSNASKRTADVNRVKEATTKRVNTQTNSARRKAAAPTRSAAGSSKVTDYLDDSDEAYEDWYKKIENAH